MRAEQKAKWWIVYVYCNQYLKNMPVITGIEGDYLLGTMVLWTSEYLTATEQQELTNEMVEKLTALQ